MVLVPDDCGHYVLGIYPGGSMYVFDELSLT